MFIICKRMPNETIPTKINSFFEYESDNDNLLGIKVFLTVGSSSILKFLFKRQLDKKTPKIIKIQV